MRLIIILLLYLTICLSFISNGFSQNELLNNYLIDYNKVDEDSLKIKILLTKIGVSYEKINLDSALYYYFKSYDLSFRNENLATKESDKNTFFYLRLKSLLNIGLAHYFKHDLDSASIYQNRVVSALNEVFKKDDTEKQYMHILSSAYNNLGVIYYAKEDYYSAVEYYLNALKINEQLDERYLIFSNCNNIGLIYREIELLDKALEYFNKAKAQAELFSKSQQAKKEQVLATIYLNIGNIHKSKEEYVDAIKCYLRSIDYKNSHNDIKGAAIIYNNMGDLYMQLWNFKKANLYLEKSLKIREQINDKKGYGDVCINIAQAALEEYKVTKNKTLLNRTIKYAQYACDIFSGDDYRNRNAELNRYLFLAYFYLNKKDTASYFANEYIQLNDSIISSEVSKAIVNTESKYKFEKNEATIKDLSEQNELNSLKQEQQRFYIFSLIAGVAVLVLSIVIIIGRLHLTRKAKKNAEKQHRFIEKQKELIDDSIQYAKSIQKAVIPDTELLDLKFPSNYFVLFKPKDVVSGDFYWFRTIGNQTVLILADCTGHGVPGAFMSMLGISMLNDLIPFEINTKQLDAATILNNLRTNIILAMNQSNEVYSQRDGMDMGICIINHENKECNYAGAKMPLYIVRDKNKEEVISQQDMIFENRVLYEVTPDKMPVAMHLKMKPFENKNLRLMQNDVLYLFTDGYKDQIGGGKAKKYLTKRFKKLLIENSHLPMEEQKVILENNFQEWINMQNGIYDQMDDVTILGIKIN